MATSRSRRVLFVGDSFLTYCNDLDVQVAALAAAAGIEGVEVEREVQGGAPLKALWHDTEARQRIAAGRYDIVVLQEDLPETDLATFREYARRFAGACAEAGAGMVLLAAWGYRRLGWISTEEIAQVGMAWKRAQSGRAVRLLSKDRAAALSTWPPSDIWPRRSSSPPSGTAAQRGSPAPRAAS
ncbi:unnamed protein product [Prorocentrum cordatum]|uniref:Uncharacterized protein n=1 Tax=Prorocentrum cordatum TaxID=2364126 RepID=A0ABN9Y139_9DINO|nr:unnamed protein product [Polarella glacialis]